MFDNIDADKLKHARTEVSAYLGIRFGRKHRLATVKVNIDTRARVNVLSLSIITPTNVSRKFGHRAQKFEEVFNCVDSVYR